LNHQLVLQKDYSQDILFKQIQTLNKSAYFILITYAVTAAAFVFVMWGEVSYKILIIWSSLFATILLLRAFIHYKFNPKLTPENSRLYGYYIVCTLGITGLTWGLGVMLMFPGLDQAYQFFIIFIIAGIGSSAFSSNIIFLQGLYAFFPALIFPLAIRMLLMDERLYVIMGAVIMVFMVSLYYFSKNLNGALVETLALRFENSDLVEQLKIQKSEAESANLAKSKFLAAASHDLRQPLHALMLNVTLLDERNNSDENRPVIQNIFNSVSSLEGLFNSLLDVSRLDAGVVVPDPVHFKLATILKKLNTDYKLVADEKGLVLTIPETDLVALTDPVLLERILRNLVLNGIRYTNKGTVKLAVKENNGKIDFIVSDSGIGIEKEDIDSIFEEFVQLNNPERDRSKGLGLGLSIVKRLSDLLGCGIYVQSCVGQSTAFCFSVPSGDADLVSQQAADQCEFTPIPVDHFVVIIDDEKSIREGLQRLLESWCCTVLAFGSEEEALEVLKEYEYPPDVLLVDYRLRKNRTGIEAITAINDLFDQLIPALIITGDTSSERLKEAESSGYRLLHKPLHPSKLRIFLQNLTRIKQ